MRTDPTTTPDPPFVTEALAAAAKTIAGLRGQVAAIRAADVSSHARHGQGAIRRFPATCVGCAQADWLAETKRLRERIDELGEEKQRLRVEADGYAAALLRQADERAGHWLPAEAPLTIVWVDPASGEEKALSTRDVYVSVPAPEDAS